MYLVGNDSGELAQFLCSVPDGWHARYLQWTTEPPTEPGWYWVRRAKEEPMIVEVFVFMNNVLMVQVGGEEKIYKLELFNYWLGPLPEPELPE